MKTHVVIPLIASLTILAANVASASALSGDVVRATNVVTSKGGIAQAPKARQANLHSFEMRDGGARIILVGDEQGSANGR